MKKMRKFAAAVLAAVLAMTAQSSVFAAETETEAVTETASEASSEQAESGPITITDIAGQEYTFDKPLDKVIVQWSAAGGPFMTMSALLGDEVADHLAFIDDDMASSRADMWAKFTEAVPEIAELPTIGRVDKDTFDVEAAIASGADAAIFPVDMKAAAEQSVQSKLEAAGIPVIYINYHDETVENHVKSTEILGKLFGKEERAQEIIDFYKSHIETVTDRVAKVLETKERPSIYIEVAGTGPDTYGKSFDNSYMWGGIAYECGAENIGDGSVNGTDVMDPEAILTANPDKIVFTGSYWVDNPESVRLGYDATEEQARELMDGYLQRDGWSDLNAVKNGEVYAVHHGLGREMYDCACYEFFAKVCFPEEFSDLDPEATLKEYFETFLPYEYSGCWFVY